MEPVNAVWLSGLVLGTAYLSHVYRTEFAFNIPYHLACIALALSGLLLILFAFLSARVAAFLGRAATAYIPLHDDSKSPKHIRVRSIRSLSEPLRPTDVRTLFPARRRVWLLFAAFVACLCARVELARRVIGHSQCGSAPIAATIPFLLTTFRALARLDGPSQSFPLPPGASRLQRLVNSRWRNVVPALLLSWGAMSATSLFPAMRSTYICALGSPFITWIPIAQIAGTFVDVTIIAMLDAIISLGRDPRRAPPVQKLADPGWAALTAYTILTVVGIITIWPINRYWYTQMPVVYITSSIKLAVIFSLTTLSALQLSRRIGVVATTFTTFFVALNSASLTAAWASSGLNLPIPFFRIMFSLSFMFGGFLLFIEVDSLGSSPSLYRSSASTQTSRRMTGFVAVLFALQFLSWFSQPSPHSGPHPIPALMRKADLSHEMWLRQAGRSRNVNEAAKEYRRRYGRDPPPRFDRWFDFAAARGSLVIDDFDSMHEDLVPFWSLSPGDIRLRAFESISNNWNYIGGLQIRKGKTTITPHMPETHRWMVEAMEQMIEPFAIHLPDMDIPFNVNDEPRSAVYWHEMQGRLDIGLNPNQLPARDNGDFQPDRSWIPVPQESIEETRYRDATFHKTFYSYGSVACHPNSRARTERYWDLRYSCAQCRADHTQGLFVANWTAAADPCHQPDLADSHGLHLSPSTFRGTNELMPVFSQSKTHGYHDILYPSPWNYIDKSVYKPTEQDPDFEFADKESTLFWRGTATDGMSVGNGVWRGMLRQRLVHMINNATDSDESLVLLPSSYPSGSTIDGSGAYESSYKYHSIKPSTLREHLSASFGVVDHIQRCAWSDCEVQEREFRPDTHTQLDFQSHWRYKYLMDVDGAGFSGRFLPFLQSRSLPFKAGLAREWWDSRVTAWRHFVPVDVRFAELWSLLAYFAGYPEDASARDPADKTSRWVVRPHDDEARRIALEGRAWADKVLRKEDMEIYMFRLLLEYGRLTDDRRDELGWMGDRD